MCCKSVRRRVVIFHQVDGRGPARARRARISVHDQQHENHEPQPAEHAHRTPHVLTARALTHFNTFGIGSIHKTEYMLDLI